MTEYFTAMYSPVARGENPTITRPSPVLHQTVEIAERAAVNRRQEARRAGLVVGVFRLIRPVRLGRPVGELVRDELGCVRRVYQVPAWESIMSLFDDVVVDAKLPNGYKGAGGGFQTKSMSGPGLHIYRIAEDGQLYKRMCIEPGEGVYTDDEYMLDFTGKIRFYQWKLLPRGEMEWREYEAAFTDGKLTERIERVYDDAW